MGFLPKYRLLGRKGGGNWISTHENLPAGSRYSTVPDSNKTFINPRLYPTLELRYPGVSIELLKNYK
jgi:hypothetical protein